MKNGASDALFRGEATSFEHAMRLYRAAAQQEVSWIKPDEDCPFDGKVACAEVEAESRKAEEIYSRYVNPALSAAVTAAIAEMREQGLGHIADALESEDYSALAI